MNTMSWSDIQILFVRMLGTSLTTMELFALTLVFSLPLGLLVCLARMCRFKPVQWITKLYLLIMRGTPLMLQLIFFFYCVDIGIDRFQTAVLAFTFNYAAYFAEIYRSGIEGVPAGQREAANVLGFSKTQTFFRILFPQVIKKILPPMNNEFMTLVKDTALAQVIGVFEIFALANKIQATAVSLLPIVIAAIFYLVMNAVVYFAFSLAEKKLGYYR